MPASSHEILIVEDDYDSMAVVEQALRYRGVGVRNARDGREALDLLGSVHPTLVILDLALPELNGWETLKAMRANPDTAKIPVMAVTAYHSASVADDAHRAGFDAYFSKPIDISQFLMAIDQFIGGAVS